MRSCSFQRRRCETLFIPSTSFQQIRAVLWFVMKRTLAASASNPILVMDVESQFWEKWVCEAHIYYPYLWSHFSDGWETTVLRVVTHACQLRIWSNLQCVWRIVILGKWRAWHLRYRWPNGAFWVRLIQSRADDVHSAQFWPYSQWGRGDGWLREDVKEYNETTRSFNADHYWYFNPWTADWEQTEAREAISENNHSIMF